MSFSHINHTKTITHRAHEEQSYRFLLPCNLHKAYSLSDWFILVLIFCCWTSRGLWDCLKRVLSFCELPKQSWCKRWLSYNQPCLNPRHQETRKLIHISIVSTQRRELGINLHKSYIQPDKRLELILFLLVGGHKVS